LNSNRRKTTANQIRNQRNICCPAGARFKNEQFIRAIATASFTKTTVDYPGRAPAQPVATGAACKIVAVDADCDDESGQVELRIEAQVTEAVHTRFEL